MAAAPGAAAAAALSDSGTLEAAMASRLAPAGWLGAGGIIAQSVVLLVPPSLPPSPPPPPVPAPPGPPPSPPLPSRRRVRRPRRRRRRRRRASAAAPARRRRLRRRRRRPLPPSPPPPASTRARRRGTSLRLRWRHATNRGGDLCCIAVGVPTLHLVACGCVFCLRRTRRVLSPPSSAGSGLGNWLIGPPRRSVGMLMYNDEYPRRPRRQPAARAAAGRRRRPAATAAADGASHGTGLSGAGQPIASPSRHEDGLTSG